MVNFPQDIHILPLIVRKIWKIFSHVTWLKAPEFEPRLGSPIFLMFLCFLKILFYIVIVIKVTS